MKRTFRVVIILISVAVLLIGIGMWRHHYLKIINAEPEKVYKVAGEPNNITTDTKTPKATLEKGDDNADVTDVEPSITEQRIDKSIIPAEMDNISNSSVETIFGDIAVENLPPEAVEALKKYKEAQLAIPALNDELSPLLIEWPVDMDAVRLITEKKRKLKQQRMDALEILSVYSDEAFNELQARIERKEAADRMVDILDESASAKESAAEKESAAKIKRLEEELFQLYKDIPTMTKEDLERGEELFDQIERERSKSKK